MAQESIHEYFEEIKAIAKAERELEIEQWDIIEIGYQESGVWNKLYMYDIPRRMVKRWEWVLRWRKSRIQCLHPRKMITMCHGLYYRRKGVHFGFDKDLKQLTAAKAKLSMQERRVSEYIKANTNNMFFDPESDEQLQKVLAKVEMAKANIKAAENRLEEKWKEFINIKKKE